MTNAGWCCFCAVLGTSPPVNSVQKRWQAIAYRDFLGDISPMQPREPVTYKASILHVYQGQRHRNSHADAENTGTCIVGGEKIIDRRKDVNMMKPIIYFFVINSSYLHASRMYTWVLRCGCVAITIRAARCNMSATLCI